MRLTDNKTLEAGDFNLMPDGLVFDPEVKDCLYNVVCPAGNDDCNYLANPGEKWFNDKCTLNIGFHMTGCEIKKGVALDIPNIMHRNILQSYFLNSHLKTFFHTHS
jgi:hypothetical protein